jgi:hypothetical protein
MAIYRKIYENHHGKIPKDINGRSYEIHHIDGNHSNNNIENLKLVTIQEHYDIHYNQGDWGACFKLASRMKLSPIILSELASLNNKKRVKNGTNPFVGPDVNRKRIENGTHHLLGKNNPVHKKIKNGSHNFIGVTNPVKQQLLNGKHPSQVEWVCPYCNKHGKNSGMYTRFHGNNCKQKGQVLPCPDVI